MLIVGWGSTRGSITAAIDSLADDGLAVDHIHLTHLHPFPPNLGELLKRYSHVMVPELNKGQLCHLIRGKYLVDAQSISKVAGLPFRTKEIEAAIEAARSAR